MAKSRRKPGKPHVLYLGDWVFHMGPIFVETPFNVVETKDADLHFYGERLAQALRPKAELTCLANWDLYRLRPGEFERLVDKSAAVIVSDVEAKCFHLYPDFFDRSARTGRVETYPDRLEHLTQWVAGRRRADDAGRLALVLRRARGRRLASQPAGARPARGVPGGRGPGGVVGGASRPRSSGRTIRRCAGLPWKSFPPIFGYNELLPRDDADVLVRVRETGHPLVVAGTHGKGRVFVYASDPAPHWGINFELWAGYDAFWRQALRWVRAGRR